MLNSRLANVPPCLIGIEAGKGTHYLARELISLGHDARQVPPAYPKPFRQIHKNDFRDAYAIAEAVRRPSTRCVPVKIDDQLDLQALQRVRSRLVGQRTAVINQIRGFLLECGIAVRQGLRFLRQQLPEILAKRIDVLSPRMIRIVEDLSGDWRRLDERIEQVTEEIEVLARCRSPSPARFRCKSQAAQRWSTSMESAASHLKRANRLFVYRARPIVTRRLILTPIDSTSPDATCAHYRRRRCSLLRRSSTCPH